jgi:hypothetical protein
MSGVLGNSKHVATFILFRARHDVRWKVGPPIATCHGLPAVVMLYYKTGDFLGNSLSHFVSFLQFQVNSISRAEAEGGIAGDGKPCRGNAKKKKKKKSVYSIFPSVPLILLYVCEVFFLFNHFTVGRTPWTGDLPVARPLPKHRTTQTQKNAYTHQTSMPWMGFEHTITVSERAKTEHALERSATVTRSLCSPVWNHDREGSLIMKVTLHFCLESKPSFSSHAYPNVLYVWAVRRRLIEISKCALLAKLIKSLWYSVFICNCNARYYVMNVMKYVRLLTEQVIKTVMI